MGFHSSLMGSLVNFLMLFSGQLGFFKFRGFEQFSVFLIGYELGMLSFVKLFCFYLFLIKVCCFDCELFLLCYLLFCCFFLGCIVVFDELQTSTTR